MLKMIGELVRVESPTEDRAGVNRCVTVLEDWIRASGGQSSRSKQRSAGDLLAGRFGPARSKVKPLLLLGHLDTVWPLGTLKKMPFRVSAGASLGPGCPGHESGRGDGPQRGARFAASRAVKPAGLASAQQRRGDRQRTFAGDDRVAGKEMRSGVCPGTGAGPRRGV